MKAVAEEDGEIVGSLEDAFASWFDKLEQRHLSTLRFPEVRRAVQSLSSLYIERRSRLGNGSALGSAGKRAAFAFFFGPLHFLLVREICRALNAQIPPGTSILDLGCGTGVAGAAWSLEFDHVPGVIGFDRNLWALEESRWTYRQLGISGSTRNMDIRTIEIPRRTAIIAAFSMNEIVQNARTRLLSDLLKAHRNRAPVLIIEPIARRISSWWEDWSREWVAAGGRDDEWRFRIPLPERLALMDRAAGLDHRELTARSLWLPGAA